MLEFDAIELLQLLPQHAVLIDPAGVILATSRTWNEFGLQNGLPSLAAGGVGKNYLEVCQQEPDQYAREAHEGISRVLAGGQRTFRLKYPCHSPESERWFELHVEALPGRQGALLSHHDITAQTQASVYSSLQPLLVGLLSRGPIESCAAPILAMLGERLAWEVLSAWLVNEHGDLQRIAFWSQPQHPGSALSQCPAVLESELRSPLQLKDFAALRAQLAQQHAHAAREDGLRPVFSFPLLVEQRLLGVIECFTLRTQKPSPELVEQLSSLGAEIGQFIERSRAEKLLRKIIEHSPDALFLVDRSGKIRVTNLQAERLFGWSREELLGRNIEELAPRQDREAYLRDLESVFTGVLTGPLPAPVETDAAAQHKDGRPLSVAVSTATMMLTGEPFVLTTIRDATARHAAELQRLQVRNLESLGRLSGGLAHELNTPLQYIDTNLQFLETTMKKTAAFLSGQANEEAHTKDKTKLSGLVAQAKQAIADSYEGLHHISSIVSAMKQLASPGNESGLVDLNALLSAAAVVTHHEWKACASVLYQLEPSISSFAGYPGEVSQALMSLIMNAAQAIKEAQKDNPDLAGEITLRTSYEDRWIVASVEDNGSGIHEETKQRLFEPFFTTKPPGQGTGHGLAVVYATMQHHRGTASFESSLGSGAAFFLRFPRRD